MFNTNGRHVLALEVITGMNLAVPSDRTPIGYYIRVSTSNGRWNTTIKTAEADHSVSWNETLNIHGPPPTFLQWLMPKCFRTSETIRFETRSLYESATEPVTVCEFETTFEQMLRCDRQSVTLLAIDNQDISLTLKAQRRNETTPHTQSNSPGHACPLDRNIVIFGETGSGKSSLINTIVQTQQLAKTSNDTHGCTSTPERYPVEISGKKYILIDTPGLNEGSAGTVPDTEAKELLKNLLRELMSSRSDSIGLLVYCVRSATRPRTFVKAYNKVYSEICHKRVPIILVVEEWRTERDMESWWITNREQCNNHGMHFVNYPCDPATHVAEPSGFLRTLIAKHYAVNTSWSERTSGAWCASSRGQSTQ